MRVDDMNLSSVGINEFEGLSVQWMRMMQICQSHLANKVVLASGWKPSETALTGIYSHWITEVESTKSTRPQFSSITRTPLLTPLFCSTT